MSNVIRIKRSTTVATPTALSQGEVAYSENSGNLFIGTASNTLAKIGGLTDVTKLSGIESGATADQTAAQIKTAYQGEASAFTDAQFTKLSNIETGATADQTAAQIKTAYQGQANAFTDAQFTKLGNIETGATADQTNSQIKTAYEANADTNAFTDALSSKLGAVEASADVTDATNVAAAGAVMEGDTTTAAMNFVIDEDSMATNTATKVPTQQSVKAYVDGQVTSALTSEMSFKGDYNASTNAPNLDAGTIVTIAKGDTYVVTTAGNFFSTAVEVGDTIMAKIASATATAHWVVINRNLDNASIKVAYEANSNTNVFTDAQVTNLGNQSGTNTGDEPVASATVSGTVELATQTEVNTGTDTGRAVTPATLASASLDGGTF